MSVRYALPLAGDWTLGTNVEAVGDYGIRLKNIGAATDLFDSDVDYLSGGDGAKSNGWNLLNGANADAIDANTTNAGKLTINNDGTSTGMLTSTFTCPYLYKEVSGDFDIEVTFQSNGDATYELCALVVRDTSASAGEDWLGILIGNWTSGTSRRVMSRHTVNSANNEQVMDLGTSETPFSMRIIRSGDYFYMYYKAVSSSPWIASGDETYGVGAGAGLANPILRSNFGDVVQVGICSNTDNTSDNFVSQCYNFTVNFNPVFSALSPEAESPWIPILSDTLDATTPVDIDENLLGDVDPFGAAVTSGSVKYQYATNGGSYNGSWVTLATMKANLASATITDHTSSLRIKAQLISTGTQPVDFVLSGYIKGSDISSGGGGGTIIGSPIVKAV